MSAGEPVHESQRMAIEHLTQTIAFKHAMLTERDAEIARLTDELAGTIKVREQAFEKIARLRAEVDAKHDYACRMDGLAEERNIEIQRLRADLARVTAQRDRLAIDMQNSVIADNVNSGEEEPICDAVKWMAKEYGLRIENGEVKDIEG